MAGLALVVVACSLTPSTTPTSVVATSAMTTTAAPTTIRECEVEPQQRIFIGTDPVELSLALTNAMLRCADEVVVGSGTPGELKVAAELAAFRRAPLLIFAEDALTEIEIELRRLAPTSITVVGDVLPAGIPAGTSTTSLTVAEAAAQTDETPPSSTDVMWLADARRPDLAAPVIAAAGLRGDRVVFADPHNMLGDQTLLETIQGCGHRATLFVAGGFDPVLIEWQAPRS